MEVIRNGVVVLGVATSTEIAQEQVGAQRSVVNITNLEAAGGNTAYLAWDAEAESGKGVVLAPGQTWTESMDAGYKPSNRRICAIAAAAISLAIHERLIVRE